MSPARSCGEPLGVALFCHASRGGSTRIAVELAGALAERGHDVHLFSLSPLAMRPSSPARVRIHTALSPSAVPRDASRLYLHWTPSERLRFLRCVVEAHARAPFDVVHFHYALPFAALAAELAGMDLSHPPRIVGTLHGTDVSHFGMGPQDVRALRRDLSCTEVLTTVSGAHARLAARRLDLGFCPDVIPNFVDVTRFRPPATRSDVAGRALRLVHVSNYRPVKNLEDLVRVFARVRRVRAAELWLVGDGEGVGRAREIARQERVDDGVRYLGVPRDMAAVLARCADLLLCTSHEESFCLAALEAMACGVPVVASRVGGIPELIRDGDTGSLYEPGDVEGASRAIVSLCSDRQRLGRMRAAARRRALDFERGAVVARYEALYRRALASALPRRIAPAARYALGGS